MNFLKSKRKNNKGISIVEIIISSAIIVSTVALLVGAIQVYAKMSAKTSKEVQAVLLIEEASEAVQILRDSDWNNILNTVNGDDYYLSFSEGSYSLGITPVLIDNVYTRKISFSEIERDGSDSIAVSGTLDANSKQVNIDVSWEYKGETLSKSSDMLIHNVYEYE